MKGGLGGQRQRRIARQAADWNMRMLEPESEREVEAFEAWLAADPAHAAAYVESDELALTSRRLPRSAPSSEASARTFFDWSRPAIALAATLVLIIASTFWLGVGGPPPVNAALSNPGPAVRGVTFRDGSAVILDVSAKLRHGPSSSAVLESGRVRFDAPPDGAPLSVSTPHAVVTGRGSVFDLALDGRTTLLWVVAGAVEVRSARVGTGEPRTMRVRSGQAASVSGGHIRTRSINPEAARWPAARVSFTDVPLAEIVAVANRRGDPPIILESPAIGTRKVTGVLDLRDTDMLARKLAAALDLKAERRKDAIHLGR